MRRVNRFFFVCTILPLAGQHGSTTAVNPYTSPIDRAAGANLYKAQCASCHGPQGGGTAAGPSLTSGTFKHGGTEEGLFQTISMGVPGTSMPAFNKLNGLETWRLITHIRALGIAKGSSLAKGSTVEGERIYKASGCSGCHAISGKGGLIGPDLTAVAQRRTLGELKQAVVDPDAVVPSEYWSMSAQTSSGQKVSGTRLNEDTHSVQIRDEKGRLISLLKRDLTRYEIIRKSQMPSFAGKLKEREVGDLLAYLTTLQGSPKGGVR
jgi:cytochrome c oxidase cbb3-type subunit III